MKKNIGFFNMESSLVTWLNQQILNAVSPPASALEFTDNLNQLSSGAYASLIVEVSDNTDAVHTADDLYKNDIITAGDLSVNLRLRRVISGNKEIYLTPKEFDILYFLISNKGEVFTKEQIYRAVWESDYLMDDSNIMAFIRKLRKKIEPEPDAPRYIITIWGIGYKFNDNI